MRKVSFYHNEAFLIKPRHISASGCTGNPACRLLYRWANIFSFQVRFYRGNWLFKLRVSVFSEDSPVTVTTVYVLCIYSLAILDTTHLELCEQERILEYSLDRFDEVRLQRSGVLLLGVARHQELLQRLVTFV